MRRSDLTQLFRVTLNRVICVAVWASIVSAQHVSAAESAEFTAWRVCAREASATYDVPLVALTLIYEMEGGRLGEETPNRNKDGEITSYDIGPMQINSQHLSKLSGYGITRAMLRDSMCVNVHVAAWMMRGLMRRHDSLAEAIAHYHSPTPHFQAIYLERATKIVARRLDALQRESIEP